MKRTLLSLITLLFSITFLLTSAAPSDASNNFFTISPTINDILVNPGQTIQKQLLVKNGSNQNIGVIATIQKFSPTGNNGEISFSDGNDSPLMSINNTTTISETIPPYTTTPIPVTIFAPINFSPGGYYYSIIVKEVSKDSNVSVTPNIAALYFITVNGELNKSAVIKSFDIPHININGFSIITGNNITFTTIVKNTGNIHILPQINIKTTNTFGNLQTFRYPSHTIIPGESLTLSTSANLNLPKFFDKDIFTESIINEGKVLDTKQYSLYILNTQNILYAVGGIFLFIAILILAYWGIKKRAEE